MGGAWLSGRLAGRIKPKHQIRHGFVIMLAVSLRQPRAQPAVRAERLVGPVAAGDLFAFGWALMVPVVTLMVLDLVPERRGMASSFQAFIGSMANGLVAGVDRAAGDAFDDRCSRSRRSRMMSIGIVAWIWVKPRVT